MTSSGRVSDHPNSLDRVAELVWPSVDATELQSRNHLKWTALDAGGDSRMPQPTTTARPPYVADRRIPRGGAGPGSQECSMCGASSSTSVLQRVHFASRPKSLTVMMNQTLVVFKIESNVNDNPGSLHPDLLFFPTPVAAGTRAAEAAFYGATALLLCPPQRPRGRRPPVTPPLDSV